tara:strand:+ start:178912 stop:179256 length:345 start_codon:yes stop_codon:yes gene_type:complete
MIFSINACYFGETVQVHMDRKGDFGCPICGLVWHGTKSWGATGFLECLEVCQCCHTQLGNDDVDEVLAKEGNLAFARWKRLRLTWLEKTSWSQESLQQLRDNLGLDITRPEAVD